MKILKELEKIAKDRTDEAIDVTEQMETLLLNAHKESDNALKQIGLDQHLNYRQKIKEDGQRSAYARKVYSKDEFLGKELAQLCHTWDFRVLSTSFFAGDIPVELGGIIAEFNEKHDIDPKSHAVDWFIMAPTEMFNVEIHQPRVIERPRRDPILLYRTAQGRIGDNTAYEEDRFIAVHNWGNDFKWTRKLWWLKSNYRENTEEISIKSKFIFSLVFLIITAVIPSFWSLSFTTGFIGGFALLFSVLFFFSGYSTKEKLKLWWNKPVKA